MASQIVAVRLWFFSASALLTGSCLVSSLLSLYKAAVARVFGRLLTWLSYPDEASSLRGVW